jgi:hypothetical protein
MSYTVWDLETTIRSNYKRKGNPFDPDNFIVMSGFKRKSGRVTGEYFGTAGKPGNKGLPADWFVKLLAGTTILVGQNIKFDILHALMDRVNRDANRKAWMAWVAAGGNVWDCQLAEYLLNGMAPADHMLSMDELAPRYGGNLKFDEVKAMWQAGISTEDIDRNLLHRYLCGTEAQDGTPLDHGDIGNTEVIFLGQLDRARACGQVKSILLNMGSLLCTTEMELNGMAVDVELGEVQALDLEERITKTSIELAAYLPADLPFDFNWSSSLQKSAIIFGGTVKYQKRTPILDEAGNQAYTKKVIRAQLVDELGFPVTYKSGKNAGESKYRNVTVDDLDKPKSAMRDYFYDFTRVTEPKKAWAGEKEGVWSTNAEIIKELGNRDIPFLAALSTVSGLIKDLGTYYIVTDPDTGESKGMLTLVQADGIIHHMLNHTSTVTARFSSSSPNLQNLPLGDKSKVKQVFVSRFKGGKIIQSDFKSLEVFVQAILTKCAQLIEDLKQGLDMHCVRVSQKEGIPYAEALRLCVTEKLAEWVDRRTKAKKFSFKRAYGAGATAISEQEKIPIEDVKALIAAEEARYPEVDTFYADLTEDIKANRQPTQRFCQHPDIPGLTCNLGKSYWRTPDNKLYTWRENPSPEFLAKRGTAQSFSPTEIKNYPIQGTGGEWAKAAMWLAIRAFYAQDNFGGLALLVNQVHDALYADADPTVAEKAAALLHACMEEASTFMEWYFAWELPLPVPTDTHWGPNMLDDEHMPEGFELKAKGYAAHVRSTYINGYQPSYERPIALAA